jgi:hypothetical protein
MSEQNHEELTKQTLLGKAEELERLGDVILRAAEGRRPLPTPLKDSLRKIADLTVDCEDAITEHLDEALTKEALTAVVAALNAIHGSIDSLIVYQALEGSSYSTTTVAND